MTALYEIAAAYRSLAEKLNDTDLDEQTILDTLEGASGELVEKITNIGFVVRNIEAEIDAMKQAENSISVRRKAKENRLAHLKAYLLANMIATGKTKVESPWFCLSVRNNPESVVIDADSLIPIDYMREIPASYAPDKTAIKQAIKDGFEVPGCRLAHTQSLSIK